MKKINFEEYNQKRTNAKIDILELYDNLKKKKGASKRKRSTGKEFLLYELAQKRKNKQIKKIGPHRYRFKK